MTALKNLLCRLIFLALGVSPLLAHAEISFELPTVVVQVGHDEVAQGFIDVRIKLEPSDLPQSVSSFNTDFSVSNADIDFGPATVAPDSLFDLTPQDFSPNSQRSRSAVDVFPASVAAFDAAGLIRVPFQSTASASGVYSLMWNSLNELSDASATPLPLLLGAPGQITIERFGAGDFDFDNDVDGFDFLQWQRNPSIGDLVLWESNYDGASITSSTSTVPEPTTIVMVISALAARMGKSRRYFAY